MKTSEAPRWAPAPWVEFPLCSLPRHSCDCRTAACSMSSSSPVSLPPGPPLYSPTHGLFGDYPGFLSEYVCLLPRLAPSCPMPWASHTYTPRPAPFLLHWTTCCQNSPPRLICLGRPYTVWLRASSSYASHDFCLIRQILSGGILQSTMKLKDTCSLE